MRVAACAPVPASEERSPSADAQTAVCQSLQRARRWACAVWVICMADAGCKAERQRPERISGRRWETRQPVWSVVPPVCRERAALCARWVPLITLGKAGDWKGGG